MIRTLGVVLVSLLLSITLQAQGNLDGPGGVMYPSSSPSGKTCSGNAILQAFGGVVYSCQSGTYQPISGGGGGSGTVTSFSSNSLSPLFSTNVNTPTTTPALVFSLTNASANSVFGNSTSSTGAPTFYTPVFTGSGIGITGTWPTYTFTNSNPMTFPGSGVAVSTGSSWGSSLTTPFSVNVGGSGASTFTTHGVLFGNGTSAFGVSAVGIAGQALVSGGASANGGYGALNLAGGSNIFTGLLPFTNMNLTSSNVLSLWTGTCNSTTYLRGDGSCNTPGGTMVYPGAGIPISTGSAWTTSVAAPTGSIVGTGQANTWTSGLQSFAAVPFMPQVVSSDPSTCQVGQVVFNTSSTAGQNWWFCTATNTWTQQLNSGGSGGSGTVNSGLVNQLAYYAANGTAVSGISALDVLSAANVLMYGVKGDCNSSTATAETTAIQAVLNTYSIVYFPPAPGGCYAINSALVMKSNQKIYGAGFIDNGIKQISTTADAIDAKASLSGSRDIVIQDLNITDGVLSTRTAGNGIDIDGTGDTAIFTLERNQIYGFEDGEHLVNPIASVVIRDRANNSLANGFSVTGPSTSTNFLGTYGDAPTGHCYNIGDLQYSAFIGTACDAATVDGYHFYAESGGRPKNITLIPAGNETAGRYGIYTEGQSFSILNPAISTIATGSGNACIALNAADQISIQGGQCTGGDYAVNVLADPNYLPASMQGSNSVSNLYASGQAISVYHDPSGYLNITGPKRNWTGAVPVTQLHEVTTPTVLATTITVTGQLNNTYQVFTYHGGGTYTTNADEVSPGTTLTFTLNACANATCSSGRNVLATWTTGSIGNGTVFSNTWNTNAICQVQTTGSTGTIMCHGSTATALTSGGAPVLYNDNNTSALTLDMTAQYYIGMMVQKSTTKDTGITQDTNIVEFKLY